MSEEEGTTEQEPQISEDEALARQSGWTPEEEWEGDPDGWVSAKEFNFRGELMSRIQKQTRQLQANEAEMGQLKEGLKSLGEHNKKIAEIERTKAIKALRKERLDALEEQDHERAVALEEEIDELKELSLEEEAPAEPAATNQPVTPPEVQAWLDKPENSWYSTDMVLQGVVDGIGRDIMAASPDTTPGSLIAKIEAKIDSDPNFSKLFEKVRPSKAGKSQSSVNTPSGSSRGGKKKFTASNLNDEQKQMAQRFVDAGAFKSTQEYVDQLVELGELG